MDVSQISTTETTGLSPGGITNGSDTGPGGPVKGTDQGEGDESRRTTIVPVEGLLVETRTLCK